MGVVKLAFLLILYTAIPVFILLCTPGLPPDMKFEAYNVTPPVKLEGKLSPNNKLDRAELLHNGEFSGPESVAVRGVEVFTGVMGGQILRLKNGKWEKVVQTGNDCDIKAGYWDSNHCGRPLGLRFDPSGTLLVADASQGLLRVDVDKKTVTKLLPRFSIIDNSGPLNLVDDVAVTKDGIIYMSDAGQHSGIDDFLIDVIGEPTGRLIKYNPKTKKSEVLISKLRFANGVQLSSKEDFILVSETGLGRVMKHHLTGSKAGTTEVFVDGLPGFPDNIRSNGKNFYIALVSSRSFERPSGIDQLAQIPWARKLLVRFATILVRGLNLLNSYAPHQYIGKAISYVKHFGPIGDISAFPNNVIIVEVDESGKILGSLQNKDGKISYISEIGVGKDYTYFGSPFTSQLWRIKTEYII